MVPSVHHSRYVKLQKHLKKLRLDAGLSQVELAARLQEEQSNISRTERGIRYVDALFYMDWCRACGKAPHEGMKLLEEQDV